MKLDILEYHTTDLADECLQRVKLRHEGKIDATCTTALYRGWLGHEALGIFHADLEWHDDIIQLARERTHAIAEAENRPLSRSVVENEADIADEVRKLCEHYVSRQKEYFERCEVIGVELPCRVTLDLPGVGETDFASHLDLLYRTPEGILVYRDWKFRQDSPSMAYLSRNLQFGLYFEVLSQGSICTDQALGLWEELNEYAEMEWVDMLRFKPYAKKVETKIGGEIKTFKKGDERPLRNLIKTWSVNPEREDVLLRRLAERVLCMKHGLWLANPEPTRCDLCESRKYCPDFNSGG